MDGSTTAAPSRASAENDGVAEEVERESASLDRARKRQKLSVEQERGALSFLLGDRVPLQYSVRVVYETEDGQKDLKFVIRQLDGRKIDQIENRHRDRNTLTIDQISADLEVTTDALIAIEDETGASIDPLSEEFRTINPEVGPMASPADALAARFKEQLGLLSGVAREVRRVSGWSPERVGQADRRLVEAAQG